MIGIMKIIESVNKGTFAKKFSMIAFHRNGINVATKITKTKKAFSHGMCQAPHSGVATRFQVCVSGSNSASIMTVDSRV